MNDICINCKHYKVCRYISEYHILFEKAKELNEKAMSEIFEIKTLCTEYSEETSWPKKGGITK